MYRIKNYQINEIIENLLPVRVTSVVVNYMTWKCLNAIRRLCPPVRVLSFSLGAMNFTLSWFCIRTVMTGNNVSILLTGPWPFSWFFSTAKGIEFLFFIRTHHVSTCRLLRRHPLFHILLSLLFIRSWCLSFIHSFVQYGQVYIVSVSYKTFTFYYFSFLSCS